jgi:hypothetical protein
MLHDDMYAPMTRCNKWPHQHTASSTGLQNSMLQIRHQPGLPQRGSHCVAQQVQPLPSFSNSKTTAAKPLPMSRNPHPAMKTVLLR